MKRMHRNIHSKGRIVRRMASVMFVLLFAACLLIPDQEVFAESLSLSVNASTVKIGDKVTVSVTVPAGVSATVNLVYPGDLLSFESASETANANASTVIMTLGGYGGTNTKTTGTIVFEAVTAGTAKFSVSAPVAGNQEGDMVSLDGASASVTIKNETNEENPPERDPGENTGHNSEGNENNNTGDGGNTGGGNTGNTGDGGNTGNTGNGGGETTTKKSADNSLSSLVLSAGTLSPEFKYSTVNYKATVDNSVTSVVVSAKVSNAKATIVSVEGGEDLVVGENKIRIVVKAENGVTATYTITVTRKAAGEGENTPDPAVTPPDPQEQYFELDGVRRYPASEIPESRMQEGFELSETTLWGKSYPCLTDTFANGSLRLLYMVGEDGGDGRLYLLTGTEPAVNEFVSLRSELGFVIALPDGNGKEPDGYVKDRCALAGKGSIDAWFPEDAGKKVAAFFAVDQNGKKGWYLLDTEELTYMRYNRIPVEKAKEEPAVTEIPTSKEEKDEMIKLRKQNVLTIGISAIIVIILLIVIGLLVLRRPKAVERDKDDLEFINLKEK